MNIRRIVVGLDGSTESAAALDWAIGVGKAFKAEIVAVHAVPYLAYAVGAIGMAPPVQYDPEWAAEIKREFEEEWSKPLGDSGLAYRTIIKDGRPAFAIAAVADSVDADLIVVGRRGRGGFAEILIGSTSHELTLRCKRPVLLISRVPAPDGAEVIRAGAGKEKSHGELGHL